ncbi:hypothetical protein RE428_11860 [Marinobacter nanhaiticus D15-8W]|nr:hypothetical protein RE428_11860 [Marinobacter nanhaiticus D15-8W]
MNVLGQKNPVTSGYKKFALNKNNYQLDLISIETESGYRNWSWATGLQNLGKRRDRRMGYANWMRNGSEKDKQQDTLGKGMPGPLTFNHIPAGPGGPAPLRGVQNHCFGPLI